MESWISFDKVQRVIKFNQNAWQKKYIDINTDLKKKAKNHFGIDFLKLINNEVFGKSIENVSKNRDNKLAMIERRRKYLLSKPSYHTTKIFTENLLAIEMKKPPEKQSFMAYIKTDKIYEDMAEDVETRFDFSNYKLDRPIPKGKKK